MIDKIFAILFKWLVPPSATATPEEQYTWRIGMAGAVSILMIVLGIHIIWVTGTPPFADSGYISKSDFHVLTDEIREARIAQITTQILDLQTRRCGASGELRKVLNAQIASMLIEFKDNKDVDFPLPTCQEIANDV